VYLLSHPCSSLCVLGKGLEQTHIVPAERTTSTSHGLTESNIPLSWPPFTSVSSNSCSPSARVTVIRRPYIFTTHSCYVQIYSHINSPTTCTQILRLTPSPLSKGIIPYINPSPRFNAYLKQPNQLIKPLNNNMRPLISFQLLLTRTLDQNCQSSRVIAGNDVVDAVADHDQR
jgi:hypothetical protein